MSLCHNLISKCRLVIRSLTQIVNYEFYVVSRLSHSDEMSGLNRHLYLFRWDMLANGCLDDTLSSCWVFSFWVANVGQRMLDRRCRFLVPIHSDQEHCKDGHETQRVVCKKMKLSDCTNPNVQTEKQPRLAGHVTERPSIAVDHVSKQCGCKTWSACEHRHGEEWDTGNQKIVYVRLILPSPSIPMIKSEI